MRNLYMAHVAVLVASSGCYGLQFMEIMPLKGAMLGKTWQKNAMEVDQKIGGQKDGGIGVLRYGEDLGRRTQCSKALDMYVKSALALQAADKTRKGPRTTSCYATLGGAGPNTLSMVKKEETCWTLNFLFCNPDERDLDVIAAAEAETINCIVDLAGEVPVRFLPSVEPTLVVATSERAFVERAEDGRLGRFGASSEEAGC